MGAATPHYVSGALANQAAAPPVAVRFFLAPKKNSGRDLEGEEEKKVGRKAG